ncbi:chaperonin 10-like protein [Mycena albidolilacea]|uniref:Chaperonin 10-like protein n=1 Tax=Mycena albidolilacea TaxID=1033008 RepID=A0AAD7ANQ2_9AGAR|nr:chaperonin 10-like protein [Mycena albidolilacea]
MFVDSTAGLIPPIISDTDRQLSWRLSIVISYLAPPTPLVLFLSSHLHLTMKTMKALVTTGDARFVLADVPIPVPRSGEILINVAVIAQNPVDWKYLVIKSAAAGKIIGWDFSGTVSQLGPHCQNRRLNDRVAGFVPGGAFAEYLVIPEDLVIVLPETVSFEDAARLGTACITACQCLYQELGIPIPLDEHGLLVDEPILIWSGASSTGQYAIQLARLSGMRVVATAAPENHEFLKFLGADEVFDHSDSWTARKIVSATAGTLCMAVDCWSQGMSPNQVSSSLDPRGGRIATVLPYASRTPFIETTCVAANSIFGQDTSFPLTTTGHTSHVSNGIAYCKLISHLLTLTKLKFPPAKQYPRGLLSVLEGMEYMRQGKVHAEKIIYRISDTPLSKIAKYMYGL